MDKFTALEVFVTVVDSGSQTAAADKLGLSRPVVSRYLAELETWAGARLLHRTTRRLSLTAAGNEVLPRCRQLLETAGEIRGFAAAPDSVPRGLLRVTCSTSFGHAQLAHAMAGYVQQFPEVRVDLVLLDRLINLVEERIDLAVRITGELDPNLIARRLTICRSVLCASPAYVAAHPPIRQVADIARHNCLTHTHYGTSLWAFDVAGEPASVAVSGNISANDSTALVQAALSGAGVALLPTFMVSGLIDEGRLVRLLPEAAPTTQGIYAVYASRKHMTAALRSLVDFLAAHFSPEPAWDRGTASKASRPVRPRKP